MEEASFKVKKTALSILLEVRWGWGEAFPML